jgi:hypothetical protein
MSTMTKMSGDEENLPKTSFKSSAQDVLDNDHSVLDLIKSMICSNLDTNGDDKTENQRAVEQKKMTTPEPPQPPPRRTYTRDYLLWCSQYESCYRFPHELANLIPDMPKIIKPYGNTGRIRVFPTGTSQSPSSSPRSLASGSPNTPNFAPSVLDSLPLLPTASVFTLDPETKQWEPRSRPVESPPKKNRFQTRKYRKVY